MKGLDRARIASALESWGVPAQQTPEAFQLQEGWDLRAGSGIAGNNRSWFLWRARNGGNGEKSTAIENLRALRGQLVCKRLIEPCRDVQGHAYGRRSCSRCTVVVEAPISRLDHVFWLHDNRCLKATPEERAAFLRTRCWPRKTSRLSEIGAASVP